MTEKQFRLDQVAVKLVKERTLLSEHSLRDTASAARFVGDIIGGYDREVLAVLHLNTSLQPLHMQVASIGTLDTYPAMPRDILKAALLSNARAIILVHNHPGGNLEPSIEDIQITDRLILASEQLGLQVLDHLIVSKDWQYYSMKEQGLLKIPTIKLKNKLEDLSWPNQMKEKIVPYNLYSRLESFTYGED